MTGDDQQPAEVPVGAAGAPPVALIAFTEGSGRRWSVVNDNVMGGVSRSKLTVSPHGTGVFEGVVSLDFGGGFASVKADVGGENLSACSGLAWRVRGDGRRYQLRLYGDADTDGVAWVATFATHRDWSTMQQPFSAFRPTWRGRLVPDASPLNTGAISAVSLMIADRQAGPFQLELDWVRGV